MKKILFLLFILLSLKLSAQFRIDRVKVGILSGYDYYKQEELSDLNQNVKDQLPFTVNTIDNFKPVSYFGLYTQYEINDHLFFGPIYEYHYSGSRIGAKDYSGTFSFDQYLSSHQVGLKMDYSIVSINRIILDVGANFGINFTKWKTISDFELGNNGEYVEYEKREFYGTSWHFSPSIKFGYRFIRSIYLFGSLNYSFDFSEEYHLKGNHVIEPSTTPSWEGLNASLILEFYLK